MMLSKARIEREGKEDAYVGHYGLGYHNDRGQMLVDFCKKTLFC